MQISLKRALKLRKELEAYFSKIDLPTTANVSLLVESNIDDASPVVSSGASALELKVVDYTDLSSALASIRLQIAQQNANHGIEAILSEIANIDRRITIGRKVSGANLTPDPEILKAEISLSRKALDNVDAARGYGRPDREVSVSVVSKEMRESALAQIAELKRKREELEDRRTATNAQIQIEISDGYASLLRKLGLL